MVSLLCQEREVETTWLGRGVEMVGNITAIDIKYKERR
jgi:hypothetical protein